MKRICALNFPSKLPYLESIIHFKTTQNLPQCNNLKVPGFLLIAIHKQQGESMILITSDLWKIGVFKAYQISEMNKTGEIW